MLSIVIPVYNVEDYLEQCLDSVLKLEIEKEIIVVNDGSTDGSSEILKKYENMQLNNFLVINKENEGLSEARNVGLRIAKGDYIHFIDSDDFLNPIKFEKMYKEGIKNQVDIISGSGVYYYNSEKSKSIKRGQNLWGTYREEIGNILLYLLSKKNYETVVWLNVYKRELLEKNNLIFEKGYLHEDEIFTPKTLYYAKSIYIDFNEFYYYRQREGSIVSSKGKKYYIDLNYMVNLLINFTLEENIIDRKWCNRIFWLYYSNLRDGGYYCEATYKRLSEINCGFNLLKKIKIYILTKFSKTLKVV
ncbi:MAG: glycosyltransferase [Cetobacterium sp.]